jgi:hypothetical protein
MTNPYQSPNSVLRDHSPFRQYSHAIIAATSNFVVLFALIFGLMSYARSQVNLNRVLLACSVTSILTGALFLLFRNLRWYWAALSGPLAGTAILIGIAAGMDYFGLDQ